MQSEFPGISNWKVALRKSRPVSSSQLGFLLVQSGAFPCLKSLLKECHHSVAMFPDSHQAAQLQHLCCHWRQCQTQQDRRVGVVLSGELQYPCPKGKKLQFFVACREDAVSSSTLWSQMNLLIQMSGKSKCNSIHTSMLFVGSLYYNVNTKAVISNIQIRYII